MRLASVRESREIDARTQADSSIDGDLLMEAAGTLAADRIANIAVKDVVVICGGGGNGGDGLVVARHLASRGFKVQVLLTQSKSTHKLFRKNLQRLGGIPVAAFSEDALSNLKKPAVVVDAIFGIGLNREPDGVALRAIEAINSCDAFCVSLDVPSGLNADTGMAIGVSVVADLTLTFGLAKKGFAVSDGPKHVGTLEVLPIGFPIALVREIASTTLGFDRTLARKYLPKRSDTTNKTKSGKTVIFAGSEGKGGAGILSGLAASRVGSGYVTLVTNGDPLQIVAEHPEFLTLHFADWKTSGALSKWSSAVIGPGFGIGSETEAALLALEELKQLNVVVDADALTVLAQRKNRTLLPPSWILTPHAGELSRLLSVDAKVIEADRFRFAEEASKKFGCILLLKGFRTVVSNGRKTVVILSGNAALAKAGSGDVLSGMIAGLLAQGLDAFTGACLGAYLHGRLADEWIQSERDILSLQPSDLLGTLPLLLKEIR